MVQTFAVNNLNQLASVQSSNTLTVVGTASELKVNIPTVWDGVTNVTVNGQTAELYLDGSFARAGFAITNGNNAYTAIGKDSFGRQNPKRR